MEWRPYLEFFVSNTFREFVCTKGLNSASQSRGGRDLLPFKPSAREVEVLQERLIELKRKVAQQRLSIKLHDQKASSKPRETPASLTAVPRRRIRAQSTDDKVSFFALTALNSAPNKKEAEGKAKVRRNSILDLSHRGHTVTFSSIA